MPVKQGTFGTSPIYNGVHSIASIYKGTELVYTADALAKEFITPFVVPESYNTNLVFNPTIKNASAPYETKVVSGGNLFTIGANSSSVQNGILDKTVNTSVKDLYIPSTHNGVQVYSLSDNCLNASYQTYPNIENIIIGEGIETLGRSALWYSGSANVSNVTVLPKIRLPKSLKNISHTALGTVRLYEFDTSKYTFLTDYSNYPPENLGQVFYGATVEKCYVNNTIFENDFATAGSASAKASPLLGQSGAKNTLKNLYIKNITKLGQYSIYNNIIDNLYIDNNLNTISAKAFNSCTLNMTQLKFPKSISFIGESNFEYRVVGGSIRFEHTNNDQIEFEINSSNHGPFYYKEARALDIYTDNEYIKNHDWSTIENITATLYHLDGTAW